MKNTHTHTYTEAHLRTVPYRASSVCRMFSTHLSWLQMWCAVAVLTDWCVWRCGECAIYQSSTLCSTACLECVDHINKLCTRLSTKQQGKVHRTTCTHTHTHTHTQREREEREREREGTTYTYINRHTHTETQIYTKTNQISSGTAASKGVVHGSNLIRFLSNSANCIVSLAISSNQSLRSKNDSVRTKPWLCRWETNTTARIISHNQSQPINTVLQEHGREMSNLIGCWAQISTTIAVCILKLTQSTGFNQSATGVTQSLSGAFKSIVSLPQ